MRLVIKERNDSVKEENLAGLVCTRDRGFTLKPFRLAAVPDPPEEPRLHGSTFIHTTQPRSS